MPTLRYEFSMGYEKHMPDHKARLMLHMALLLLLLLMLAF